MKAAPDSPQAVMRMEMKRTPIMRRYRAKGQGHYWMWIWTTWTS